jgi:hypothetical protein
MRAVLRSVCAVFVLAPTLVLVALSAHAHAAAGRPARPNAPGIVHVVLSSRHFRSPHRSSRRSPRHRASHHRPSHHRPSHHRPSHHPPSHHPPRRRPHGPYWRQHWWPCAGPAASPLPAGSGAGECPSVSPCPVPTAFLFPASCPSPSPSRSRSPSPVPAGTSPSPSLATPAPSPTSPATLPTVHPPPSNRLGRHRPGRELHGASAAFSRVHDNLLLQPTTRTQAGPSIRLLMILVLIPCAAVAVLRYGSKR